MPLQIYSEIMPEKAWQQDLASAWRDSRSLCRFLELDSESPPYPLAFNTPFPFLVTQSFALRMRPADWFDPLLLQVLPREEEKTVVPGFVQDAVGDAAAEVVPGLLHKYGQRALAVVTGNCAIHCRYCFRREFPYADLPKSETRWKAAWDYLRGNPDINELILSGGDPLFLDNARLERFLHPLETTPHIQTLRIHTRLPIVLPSRIEKGLLEILSKFRKNSQVVIVIHANHANELREDASAALGRLRQAGCLLFNQAVLLKGVNDTVEALENLSRSLIREGVAPYYLHQLDRVTGTAHFEVSEAIGKNLMRQLRARLPGYALPSWVREIPGEDSKTPLAF